MKKNIAHYYYSDSTFIMLYYFYRIEAERYFHGS